jgi:hypothetical protein
MLAGPLPGAFLNTIVHGVCSSTDSSALVLELGTFTGHSALCMAEALPLHGRLITCEVTINALNSTDCVTIFDGDDSWTIRQLILHKVGLIVIQQPINRFISLVDLLNKHLQR